MANFDVKRVTPLEWAGIGAGVFAFLVSFFNWITFELFGISEGLSAWNSGFTAWFPVLLLMVAGGLVLAPHFGVEVARLPLIWLVLGGVAALLILLRWVTASDATLGTGSAGFGLFLGLLAALVSGAAAFLTFRAASRTNA
ncbi:MAG TPA: hypothetical protein VGX25_20030 [Actinophytocola sp.]|uniref:hypothetical protein n=1 Tax=Actinophytocola sp. TaxID=1872138 RepID=UPI002DDD4CBE|nr:hypothetical protein [Actinophytocola sp.]HEV2781680.1 hypothetical protein [Actinophytocola sp.]